MSNMHIKHNIYSVDDIKSHYSRVRPQGHWFDDDTMEFFKCRLDGQVFTDESKELFYFVSSEKGPDMKRKYSIRSYNPLDGDIGTIGAFQQYTSTKHAKQVIERMIKGDK